MNVNRGEFTFTISDIARCLGRSAVTLRGWERQGLVSFPRNSRGDRTFTLQDIRVVLAESVVRERISKDKLKLIEAWVTITELVENGVE